MKRYIQILALSAVISIVAFQAPAAGQQQTRQQSREQIYGSQLMTEKEREAHRQRVRNAATQEKREQIRAEHHKVMQERAKERGITLPDEPLTRGSRPGMGRGQGKGPGTGAGRDGPGRYGQ